MTTRLSLLLAIGTGLGLAAATACIQREGMRGPPQMLPLDLFKLRVHVATDPVIIDVPLIGGGSASVVTKKSATDPQTEFAEVISRYEADPFAQNSRVERNDYAAALIFSHRYADAIKALHRLELDFPGAYATAANLGTAYELAGDVPNAAKWIQEGLKRNPHSHEGTEWLHLAILATKDEIARDPHWLARHSVLEKAEAHPAAATERALEYQLNERLYFIQRDDPVMCDLFYQAAVVTSDPDKRDYFLRQAGKFGSTRDGEVRSLRRKYGIDR